MDAFVFFSWGTAAWAAVQAGPLVVAPRMIVAVLSPEIRDASDLEVYFARSLGISLVALAVLSILLTGSVPLSSRLTEEDLDNPVDPKAPYAVPTVVVTTAYHVAVAFYSYTRWTALFVSSFALSVAASGILASVGMWLVLFGSSDGRISKRTGADKRTSGWPFKNAEADRKRVGKGKRAL